VPLGISDRNTTTVYDKLLNANATRWEEAQAVVASLRDCPLTWRRNTQIQMYWLWKWLESYNNCTFSTWKDKFLFNLLFWILTRFAHFMIMLGEELPCLPWRPVTDFLSFRFLNNFLSLKNRVALKLFTVMKYFLSFRTFEQLVDCPEKQSVPWIHCIEYIYLFNHSEFWTTCSCPEK